MGALSRGYGILGSLPTFQMYASQLSIVDDDTRFYGTVLIINVTVEYTFRIKFHLFFLLSLL